MAEKEKQEKSNQEEKNNQTKETNEGGRKGMKMNYAIIGGVVGAGVGLLSHPGTGKKLAGSLGKSDVVRMAGNELRRTAQEFITEQALITLRQTAAGYMGKYENGLLPFNRKKEEETAQQEERSSSQQSDEIEEIKEDNKNLNERLERIEEMLSSLVESKK